MMAAPAVTQDTGTVVWLPLNFPGQNLKTQFTAFTKEQLDILAESFGARQEELVCPKPLGIRQVFSWRLESALKRRPPRGAALDEFAILVEGLLYGLLEPETYDLAGFGLDFEDDEDRYLTVLRFRSAHGAQETVAGSFSPETLVCPAGNWQQKDELEDRVQDLRFTIGPNARALLRAFMAELASPRMLWHSGLEWLIGEYSATREESTINQRNIGPLHLRLSPEAKPHLVFFPQYKPDYLPFMVRCLNAEDYVNARDAIHLEHQGWRLMSINMQRQDNRPKLLGMGGAILRDTDPHHLPAQTTLGRQSEKTYLRTIEPVANLYAVDVESPNRRFTIPDALRAGFYAWGEAAPQKFTANVQWIYGPRTLRANFDPRPHQVVSREGPYSDETRIFYVWRTATGKLAYYIERYGTAELTEISSLGYALWRVFSGAKWDTARETAVDDDGSVCLASIDGWLGAPPSVEPKPRNPDNEEKRWSTFLTLPQKLPDGLFKAAVDAYIKRCGPDDSVAVARLTFAQIDIQGQQWWQINAM